MSIASTRDTICQKLSTEFESLVQPAVSTQAATRKALSNIKSQLRDLSFSPDSVIDDAVDDLEDTVKDIVPEGKSDDVNEAVDFINSCDFLSGNSLFSNPIALMNSAIGSTISQLGDYLSGISDSIPEFGVGNLISDIQDALSGLELPGALNITDLLKQADRLINCVAGRCGPSYASRVSSLTSQLQGLYDDFGVDDDPLSSTWGELDVNKIYQDAGLGAQQISKMEKTTNAINKSKSDALTGISNLKTSLKAASGSITGLF
jgi:hypothetical protein